MKRSPQKTKLEDVLRSSRIVSGGFMGKDPRTLDEVLDADGAELARLGTTPEELAARMRQMTDRALEGLGTPVAFDAKREVAADDNRGQIVCPWPHAGRYFKTITTVRRTDTGETLRWSELSRHFIEEHGFFQGKGSAFRLEPRVLVRMILD